MSACVFNVKMADGFCRVGMFRLDSVYYPPYLFKFQPFFITAIVDPSAHIALVYNFNFLQMMNSSSSSFILPFL